MNPVENKQPSEPVKLNYNSELDNIVEFRGKPISYWMNLKSQADELAVALEKIKYGQINHRSIDEKSWAHKHDSLVDFIDDTLEAYRKGKTA